ncbi:MAG: HlyD family secretion protein [bacterium]
MSFTSSLRFMYTERSRIPLWGMLFLMLILTCWMVWFSSVKVPLYAVTDMARLEVDQASHPVQTPIEGRIVEINMALGREVKAGDILVRLDDEFLRLRRKEARERCHSLTAEFSALQDQIAQEEVLLEEEGKIALIKLREAGSLHQEGEIEAVFAEEEVKRLGSLYAQEALSRSELLRAQSRAEKQRAAAEALRIALGRLEGERVFQKKERETRLSQLRQQLIHIQGDIQKNTTIMEQLECEMEKHRIKAPVSGRIAEIANMHAGMFIQEGCSLGSILPGGNLKAVAHFDPSDAMGKVSAGQKAYLRLKGFSWLQYRSVAAQVERVSRESRYGRIRVDLRLISGNCPIQLQHGLPARVEIETERITPAVLVLRKAGKVFSLDPPSRTTEATPLTAGTAGTRDLQKTAMYLFEAGNGNPISE